MNILPVVVYFGTQKLIQHLGKDVVPMGMGAYVPMIAAVLCFLISSKMQSGSAGKKTEVLVGKAAPDFGVSLKDGDASLNALVEKSKLPTVIDFYRNFWPACGPAAKEIDKMAADPKYAGKVNFLLVNLGSVKEANDYAEKQGLKGAAMHGAVVAGNGNPGSDYGLTYIPHKVLVDAEGVVARNFNLTLPADLDALLEGSLDYKDKSAAAKKDE